MSYSGCTTASRPKAGGSGFSRPPLDNDAEVTRLLRADRKRDCVLVAEAGGHISGVALYFREPQAPDRAEVAFAIADALQGRGVGTRMLEVLAGIARDHRITTFDAYVLHDNRRMMQVFLDSGLETHCQLEGGVFHVVLALEPTARLRDQSRRTIAGGGDRVDEELFRAADGCDHRRES